MAGKGALRAIKRRIGSVENTKQITRAMYMVSSAKLRRAQSAAESSRPYSESLSKTIADLVTKLEHGQAHPLLKPREQKNNAELLLFTSDRGLCGGYNSSLISQAEEFMALNKEKYQKIEFTMVGKKGSDYFKRRKYEIRKTTTNLVRNISFEMARELADEVTERFTAGEVDEVYIIYSVFRSALRQVPATVKILPFEFEQTGEEEAGAGVDYIYEPSITELLDALLPRQVRTQVYRAMLESVASEHGARMTAMDNATTNAEEMIEGLTRTYNRARQEAITMELMDIVGGKEALEKG